MKKFYRLLLFICACAVLSVPAVAQITITDTDVTTHLAVGNTLTNNTDSLTTSANIGAPGSTSWDFSTLLSSSSLVLTSVVPASTPFIADFPGATHALKSTLSGLFSGFPGVVTGDLYLYLKLTSCLEAPGSKGSGTVAFPPFGELPGTLTITNAPPDTTYLFPSSLGTTWKTTNTTTTAIVLAGSPLTPTVVNHDITYTVDAFGPMTIPGGATFDALRIRKVENSGTQTIGYIFLAKNGASVQLTAVDNLQPDNGVIQLQRSSVTWNGPSVPLPIQLSYFNASLTETSSQVLLRWRTLSELNNFGFEAQKGTAPNGNFQAVTDGFVAGHGTTNVPQEYGLVDKYASRGTWYYRLKQVDLDGSSHFTETIKLDVTTSVSEGVVPTEFSLNQNYPNPFNPSTTIHYGLPFRATVSLVVYNSLGQVAATLVNGEMDAGYHEVKFEGSTFSSGVYFYRLQAGTYVETRKLILIR